MSHCDSLGALPPLPPAMPATPTPNESLRLVGGSPTPSTCNASHTDPQRVITTCGNSPTPSTCNASHTDPQRVILTCWGLSIPLHLRCQPHRPPTSHFDSLGALF